MGNRAAIVFDEYNPDALGIYVHWNGGRPSIEGFLKATRILMGGRMYDETYSRGRLVQVIATFFPGNLSFGMGKVKNLDYGDNGIYIIDSETLTIKGRAEFDGREEQTTDEYTTNEFANEIIKVINGQYEAANKDAEDFMQTALLPTAEEYDAEQAAAK